MPFIMEQIMFFNKLEICLNFVDKCPIMSITNPIKLEQQLNKEIALLLKRSSGLSKNFEVKPNTTYNDFLSNKFLIILAIRAGVPYSLFNLIQHYSPFTETDWADLLDVSQKTLQRYKQTSQHQFKPSHSEKIIEMAEVTHMGLQVFDTMDQFKHWLQTPNFALGKINPMELLKDSYGKELVIAELTRIHHGIFV